MSKPGEPHLIPLDENGTNHLNGDTSSPYPGLTGLYVTSTVKMDVPFTMAHSVDTRKDFIFRILFGDRFSTGLALDSLHKIRVSRVENHVSARSDAQICFLS